ncbi:SWIRM domain-containing protein [Aulographum hederae CBS 113979]|uniref:Transcriptional adapter 2 n=1 Tax=Aulographum hederae CBS 113979 TaxID=1176131 RepID=A0A6G1H2E6_9PEZI|nr:SWIRM domain-containing protein [Aulographum hederae CBS 113979]
MGVIKKKTAVRGTEGGVKYVCDVCSADITSTVRISCVPCKDYDLCVPCFSEGKSSREHDPQTHRFRVIEQHSIPIYTEDWGADEELLLLEGAETYGLGSWADIADHIGGYRTKDEVRDHYINTYIESSKFPLPERASVKDKSLSDAIPREEFQARKKRRIETRKEAAKNASPATPKTKPTASVPSCHEVAGYMPGRLEFEAEYFNEAEEAVMHMQFDPGDGVDPRTGEVDPEMSLKITIMEIYNGRLKARVDRKKILFEHKLLEYRKNTALEKKRTKEERDLMQRVKPFARMMPHADYEEFLNGISWEHNLRQAITQLQEWRQMQIGDLKAGEKYETEKQQRVATRVPLGQFDRLASSRMSKPTPPVEQTTTASNLVAPELPIRLSQNLQTPPGSQSPDHHALTNGTANGVLTPQSQKNKFVVQPLPNYVPLKFKDVENIPDLHLLTPEERDLCSVCRLMPKPYIALKEAIIKESIRQGGALRKKTVREIAKIDTSKAGRLYDFFVHNGWIGKA